LVIGGRVGSFVLTASGSNGNDFHAAFGKEGIDGEAHIGVWVWGVTLTAGVTGSYSWMDEVDNPPTGLLASQVLAALAPQGLPLSLNLQPSLSQLSSSAPLYKPDREDLEHLGPKGSKIN